MPSLYGQPPAVSSVAMTSSTSRVVSATSPSGGDAFSPHAAATDLPSGRASFAPPTARYGDVAFVQGAFVLPGVGAAGAAGATVGSAAALPALAAIAGGVLLVSAGVWAMTPESQRAQLSKQARAAAQGILSAVPGLSRTEVAGYLKSIDSAFHQGADAVKALASSWLRAAQAPAATPGASTSGRPGRPRSAHQTAGVRQSGRSRTPAAVAPRTAPSAPPMSAADRRTLEALRAQAAGLQAQARAGRVLSPAQLANGGAVRQLERLHRSVEALLLRPGAAAHRAELTSLPAEARQHVAGMYRLTANKAVAGLLTAQTQAGQQTRAQAGVITPYSAQALGQLLAQARSLLNAQADAPLLAALNNRLSSEGSAAARRGSSTPVSHAWPGSSGSSAPVPPGQIATVTHTGSERGGMATGDAAGKVARRAAQERAERLEQAVRWVNEKLRTGRSTASPEALAQEAATLFGLTAGDVGSALAAGAQGAMGAMGAMGAKGAKGEKGAKGAQGGVRASAGGGASGGFRSASGADEKDNRQQRFDQAVNNGLLTKVGEGVYRVNEGVMTAPVVIEDLDPILEHADKLIGATGELPPLAPVAVETAVPIEEHVRTDPQSEFWHDDTEAPLVVTDNSGNSYVISGWSDFVDARLKGETAVNAHHLRIDGTLQLPQGDLILNADGGASTVLRAREPSGAAYYPFAEGALNAALGRIVDSRINLADLPPDARKALVDLVRVLFERVPPEVVETARSTVQNNLWQKELDNPEKLEAFAELAIRRLAASGELLRSSSPEKAWLSSLFTGGPQSKWQPGSVSGDHSFQGFTKKLLESRDPVVNQIRSAIVDSLTRFYSQRATEEEAAALTALNKAAGPEGAPAVGAWPLDPEDVLDSLRHLGEEGTFETMKEGLSRVLDRYFQQRQFRRDVGAPAPE